MKVVTLCGSMRFSKQMQEIAMELETKHGCCVLAPIGVGIVPSNEDKRSLAKAHFKKIDISDAIYVVNINGYIGESVTQEIRYAQERGKEIIFHENPVSRI